MVLNREAQQPDEFTNILPNTGPIFEVQVMKRPALIQYLSHKAIRAISHQFAQRQTAIRWLEWLQRKLSIVRV
jgi:hypothetical protein